MWSVNEDMGGKQSDKQKEWQQLVEAMGGIYLLVRSADDFEQQLREWVSLFDGPLPSVWVKMFGPLLNSIWRKGK